MCCTMSVSQSWMYKNGCHDNNATKIHSSQIGCGVCFLSFSPVSSSFYLSLYPTVLISSIDFTFNLFSQLLYLSFFTISPLPLSLSSFALSLSLSLPLSVPLFLPLFLPHNPQAPSPLHLPISRSITLHLSFSLPISLQLPPSLTLSVPLSLSLSLSPSLSLFVVSPSLSLCFPL